MTTWRFWLLGCVAACLSAACSPVEPALATRADPGRPPMRLVGVSFEGWSGAARELSVQAREARVDPEARVAELEEVRIALAGNGSRGPLEVESPSGEFDLARETLRLHGGVAGWTQPGERFTTEELSFDHERGRLASSSPVRLERANLVLDASGMDLDLEARRLHLRGSVRAELNPR